jgi:hypothetical protein
MTQSYCEPLSPVSFPVKREITGNFTVFGSFCDIMTPDKAAEMLGFFTKFPGEGTGNYFFLIREFQKGIREFSDPCRETHLGGSDVGVRRFAYD